jgi:prepilin-type N-terminal cleavage/methylation domain-containing protein
MKKNIFNSFGFSLLEVVVTVFIAGLILLVYQASSNIILLSRNAKNQEIALVIANNKIEELRAGGYGALPVSGSFSDSQLSLLPGGFGELVVNDFATNTKEVIATVYWQNNGGNGQMEVSVPTLMASGGGL